MFGEMMSQCSRLVGAGTYFVSATTSENSVYRRAMGKVRGRVRKVYLWYRIVVLILERKESRARHCRTEERGIRLTAMRYNVLHNRPSTSGFTPNRDLRGIAAKRCDLTHRSIRSPSTLADI